MRINKSLAALALVVSAVPFAASAGESGTVYTQLTSNGLGIGYATSINKDWAARAQYSTFKYSFSGDAGISASAGSTLSVDLNLSTFNVVGDWYPSDGGFRLTGGVVFNQNKIAVTGTGDVGTATGVTVDGSIKMSNNGVVPYLGLGYGTRPKDDKGWGFNLDLGFMLQDPKASLSATGGGVAQSDIDAQLVKMQDAADKLKVMPVFGIGVSYSF